MAVRKPLLPLTCLASIAPDPAAGQRQAQRSFISLIETVQNQPTIGTLSKLARALNMKTSELVAEAEAEMLSRKKGRRPQAT